MPSETRLHNRNGTFYLLAHVPGDVREVIPGGRSGQKWISLKTKDHAEAKRRVRIRSVEFDQQVSAARHKLAGQHDALTISDADRLAAMWLSWVMEEDEESRRAGLGERELERKTEAADIIDAGGSAAFARGDSQSLEFEMEEVLRHAGLSVAKDSDEWQRLGYAMLRAQKRWAAAMRERNNGEIIDTPAPPTGASASRSCTVEQLIEAYIANPSRKRSAATLKSYNTVFRAMRELLGPDTPVDVVRPEDCERIRSILMRLPTNAKTRFPDLTLEEAAALADEKGLERLGVTAINNYLHNLSALFKWGVKTWRVVRNPAEALALPDDRPERELKAPFKTEQLNAIFKAPLFTGCKDGGEGYAKPGLIRPRNGRFWVPLLSLWTGMRLGECCQLHVEDVTELEGVPVILINDDNEAGADEADRKRIKTSAGKRFVPVHPELQRIGFLTFVAKARRGNDRRLFSELEPDKLGYLSGPFSKWFNGRDRFLGKLKLAGTGVSFHSFRHNYRDALREADMSLERVRALGGWNRESAGEENRYGFGLDPATLYKEVQKISYPKLDLSHLYVEELVGPSMQPA